LDQSYKYSSLTEAALRLKAIIETATDGIIAIDQRGQMEMANESAASLFGYDVEEMLGKNVKMLMPEPDHSNHDGYIANYLRTGEKKIIGIGREVTGRRKDGATFPCWLSISEVKLEDRIIFTGIVHDLTEQKEAEQRVIRLNAELEKRVEERTEELAAAVNQLLNTNTKLKHEIQERKIIEKALRNSEQEARIAYEKERELNQLKSRFVSMASHEFRTPLSTILSSADLIEAYVKAEQNEKRLKHTQRIKSAVANLTGILNDFLSLSKLEEGKIDTHPVTFSLRVFCAEVLDEIQGLLKTGQYIQHNHDDWDREITIDKKLLKNIFFNLLSNAIKYSEEGKRIDCLLKVEEKYLSIQVTDYGIGIPEDEQQHLFTRFFRARNVENIQGTGLGLNIVKRYVEIMQGKVTFESRLGTGTTFYVSIPLVKND
jgi:PAS domain S-box-containing protein